MLPPEQDGSNEPAPCTADRIPVQSDGTKHHMVELDSAVTFSMYRACDMPLSRVGRLSVKATSSQLDLIVQSVGKWSLSCLTMDP